MPIKTIPVQGLAKNAPIPIVTIPETDNTSSLVPVTPQPALSVPSWEGVPIDLIRYIGKDMGTMTGKDIEQLKDIATWSKTDLAEDTVGNRLNKLRTLEQQLGQPGFHETKLDRIWNWVKMQFSINELRIRQKAFER